MRKLRILIKIAINYLSYKIGRPSPFIAVFNVTQKCNLNCGYCAITNDCSYNEKLQNTLKESTETELSTEEVKTMIEKVSDLGVCYFNFSGGEPLLRDDIEELGKYAQKLNMSTSLYTNGLLLTEERIKEAAKSFDTIMISMPHSKEGKFRTKKETKKVKKVIQKIREEDGAKVGISFVMTKYNYNEIEDIAEYGKENVDFIFYNPVHYAPDYMPKKEKAKEIKDRVTEVKRKNWSLVSNSIEYIDKFESYFKGEEIPVKCNAFSLYLSILSDGNLQGCCQPFSVGNLVEDGPQELFKKGLNSKDKLLATCDRHKMMGGCGQVSFLFEKSIFRNIPAGLNLLKKSIFG